MATATELTLATGKTVYTGDPDSDERIVSREVRVSVTYRLNPGDEDVPLLAAVKAAEAERALEAAWQMARSQPEVGCAPGDTIPLEGNGSADPALHAPVPPAENGMSRYASNGNGAHPSPHREGSPVYASTRKSVRPRTATSAPSATITPDVTDVAALTSPNTAPIPEGITTPQRLAIQSLCTRQGLSQTDLWDLLEERFGQRVLMALTKTQASQLLTALQEGEWQEPVQKTPFLH